MFPDYHSVSCDYDLMHSDGEFETLFKGIEENHKEKSYVAKAFKKYLPFIFIEDDVLKTNLKKTKSY